MNQPALLQIPIGQLVESPFNPRKLFTPENLAELASSVRVQGILVPLIVRPLHDADTTPERYEIIAGARRYRAAKAAKLAEVPAIVRELTNAEAREAQIIENLQRRDITPLEEAQGFQDLFKETNAGLSNGAAKLTADELAKRLGKSPRYVHARLELLTLSDPVTKQLAAGKISASHAMELVALTPERQKEMLPAINPSYGGQISVQQLRDQIKWKYRPKPKFKPYVKSKAEIEREKKWKAERQKGEEKRATEKRLIDAARPKIIAAIAARVKTISPWSLENYAMRLLWDMHGEWIKAVTGEDRAAYTKASAITWFRKQKPAARGALLVQLAAGNAYGDELPKLLKAHGIDLKPILAAAAKELKAAEKKASPQTSAKPAKAKK